MSKSFVDTLIHNMKLAGIVTKASPWMIEGMKDTEMNVRYVGLKLQDDWLDLFPAGNNLLLKFITDRTSARVSFLLANKPPFFHITTHTFTNQDKWEMLLGEFKRRLKRDKADVLKHTEKAGNLYTLLKPQLK